MQLNVRRKAASKSCIHVHTGSYQSLISEGVVDTSNEKPEGPQVLKPELQHKVSQENQHPHYQELQVQERTAGEDKVKKKIWREIFKTQR